MGKSSAPAPPDYSPFIQASQQTSATDREMAQMQFDLGKAQLEQSSLRGEQYYQMAREAQDWGREQFNATWPYAMDYLQTQQALSHLAGENAAEGVATARENRRQATETYDRYMTQFAPLEAQFAQSALDYNSPARAAQASGAAQADVATAFDQQQKARQDALRSYDIDPTEARYQGESAIAATQKAAAQASAGTQARRAQELTGFGLEQQAIAMGQKLPTIALGQIEAATGGAGSALQAGAAGAGGISAANQLYGTGVTAGGSPVAYGYMSNPYTQLSGSLYSGANTAMGNAGSALGYGVDAMKNSFAGQMSAYEANRKNEAAPWDFMGKVAGTALGFGSGSGKMFGYSLWS